jgi:hypothetical protein
MAAGEKDDARLFTAEGLEQGDCAMLGNLV